MQSAKDSFKYVETGNYIVPIETADGVTGMKLSIVRGEDKRAWLTYSLRIKNAAE